MEIPDINITTKTPEETTKKRMNTVRSLEIDDEPIIIDDMYLFDINGVDYDMYYAAYGKSIIYEIKEILNNYDSNVEIAFKKMIEAGILGKDNPVEEFIGLFLREIDIKNLNYEYASKIHAMRTKEAHVSKKTEFKKKHKPLFS